MDPRSPPAPSLPPVPLRLDAATQVWLDLPEQDRAELLDSSIVYKTMSRPEHGDAMGAIFAQLSQLRGPLRGDRGGWWLSQDVRMYLAAQGLRPDVVGWRVDRHPTPPRPVSLAAQRGVVLDTPDWVCEVLSPSTQRRDRKEGVKLIKAVADNNRRDAKIVLIGINPIGVSLVWHLPDLAGRFISIRMTSQPDDKIARRSRCALPSTGYSGAIWPRTSRATQASSSCESSHPVRGERRPNGPASW